MTDKRNTKLVGLILISFGIIALLGTWLPLFDIEGPLFLVLVGGGLIAGWAYREKRGLLIGGCCTACLGIFAFLDEGIALGDWSGPLFFISQALAFILVWRLDKNHPKWPYNTSLALAAFSVFIMVAEGIGVISKIVVPLGLIAIGAWWIFKKND